jgi:hypothetical protein
MMHGLYTESDYSFTDSGWSVTSAKSAIEERGHEGLRMSGEEKEERERGWGGGGGGGL